MDWFKNKTIVTPLDFSEQSIEAVKFAEKLVGDERQIHVVHVIPDLRASTYPGLIKSPLDDNERKREAKAHMATALCDYTSDAVSLVVKVGDPGQTIVKFARKIDADLIVMPSHGRTGLFHMLLGSVAERVIRLSECPVLILKGPKEQ